MNRILGAILFLSFAAGVSAREKTVRMGDLIVPNWGYAQNGSMEVEAGDLSAAREAVLKAVQNLGGQLTNINEQSRYGNTVDAIYMQVVVSSAGAQALFHEIRKVGNVVQSNMPVGMGQAQQEAFLAQVEQLREELNALKGEAPLVERVAADKLKEWDNFLSASGRAMNGITVTINLVKTGTRARHGRGIGRELMRFALPLAGAVFVLIIILVVGILLGRLIFRKTTL